MFYDPKRELILPERFVPRAKQRGSIMMAMLGVVPVAEDPKIILSGTSGSPNLSVDTTTNPTACTIVWSFDTSGRVFYNNNSQSTSQFNAGTEWHDDQNTPTGDYWIRATVDSGDSPTSGASLNTWLRLLGTGSATRTWTWTAVPPSGSLDGTLQIDIALDSLGNSIVETGFYRGSATVTP